MDRREFLQAAAAMTVIAATQTTASGNASLPAPLSPAEIERRIQEILPQLSLQEKVELMSGHVQKMLLRLLGREKRYTGYVPGNERLGIPPLKCLDGPRGVGLFYRTTCFPVAMARGAAWDPDLEERVGETMGYETRALGANMLLAPCINLLWHPRWGRAQETYGEDPYHLGVMGAAFVRGLQRHVMACPKHYAVNNIENTRMEVNAVVEERKLREVFLPHFHKCVQAGAASIMSAYNDVNGYLCAHNRHLLRDILKTDWQFDGFVVSDWVNAVEDTVAAALAGLDLEMPRPEYYGAKLVKAVEDGQVPEEVINEAVIRLLRQLFRFSGPQFDSGYHPEQIAGPAHADLARQTAEKAIVLLKNENDTLPLDPGRMQTIVVLGELASADNLGDHGSSRVTPPYAVTILDGLKKKFGREKVLYERGKSPEAGRRVAARADAVVVVAGFTFKDEGEGHDRESLELPEAQQRLIMAAAEANPRTIAVLIGGAAITMGEWEKHVPAILMAWYPGMEGGNAVANIIVGKVNPSGKLPLVFPGSESQLPSFDNHSLTVEYKGFHGYRHLEAAGEKSLFPFGFGLSYTRYQYSNLRLVQRETGKSGRITAQVDVTNVGRRAGEEVVQLYIGYPGSRVERPVKELKAFTRLALAPGETKTAVLTVDVPELAFYNVEKSAWEVEELTYTVFVGPSSAESGLLAAEFKVSGP